jgi:hypothetical protein
MRRFVTPSDQPALPGTDVFRSCCSHRNSLPFLVTPDRGVPAGVAKVGAPVTALSANAIAGANPEVKDLVVLYDFRAPMAADQGMRVRDNRFPTFPFALCAL